MNYMASFRKVRGICIRQLEVLDVLPQPWNLYKIEQGG